jgi:hypothetical protein
VKVPRPISIPLAFVGLVALGGCLKPTPAPPPSSLQGLASASVRETFEDGGTGNVFIPCLRPENDFTVTAEQTRTGAKSLKLTIRKLPLFAHLPLPVTPALLAAATSCLAALTTEEARMYLNDDSERAELKEKKSGSPLFTQDFFYGFSLMIPRASAPLGDFNRMVVGQWKLARKNPLPADSPPYDSPFVALRVTGGFFHVMLTVKAALKDGAKFSPSDCRVLLAFTSEVPPNHDAPLPLGGNPQCESRLNYDLNQGQPAPPGTLRIDRSGYLPNPWSTDGTASWIDLVFHIKGGENGIVELWANGKPIAKATGWIGYEGIDQPVDTQYFKFGPYRDPAGYDTVIYLDNLARGHSFAEVDPSQPP